MNLSISNHASSAWLPSVVTDMEDLEKAANVMYFDKRGKLAIWRCRVLGQTP